MGYMQVLCEAGDERLDWDPEDQASVNKAKEKWANLKKQGYEFYEVVEQKGQKRVTRFDKKLGRVIASPGVQTAKDKATPPQQRTTRALGGGPNMLSVRDGYLVRAGQRHVPTRVR